MGSILWVISEKKKGSILWDMFKKWVQFLWVNVETEGFNTVSHVEQKGSILWVMLNRRVQFFESCWKEGFNSVSLIKKKGSIQWIIVFEKFNSLRHIQKKKVQVFESYSKKGSITWVILEKNSSILWVILEVQFFETYSKKSSTLWVKKKRRFNSVSHFQKSNGSILGAMFKKKGVQFFASNSRNKEFNSLVIFKESYFQKKSSILQVTLSKRV